MTGRKPEDQFPILKTVEDLINEPPWREEARAAEALYDSKARTADELEELSEQGIKPYSRPLVPSAIDVRIGMEVKNRRDWKVFAGDSDATNEAIALRKWLSEAERLSQADRARTLAYRDALIAGIGWVGLEVRSNPFSYPHRAYAPSWKEMYWDWRAASFEPEDCRFILRKKRFDVSVLESRFPGHAELLQLAVGAKASWDWETSQNYAQAGEDQRRWSRSIDVEEWAISADRDRVWLYEVRYGVDTPVDLLYLEDGRALEFHEQNPIHRQLAQAGAPMDRVTVTKIRQAFFVGPHELLDQPYGFDWRGELAPYAHRRWGWVPFIGFRDGETRMPYGPIRRMAETQREVNEALTRWYALMGSKTVIADEDAFSPLMSLPQVEAAVAKPNGILWRNKARRDARLEIHDHQAQANAAYQMVRDAMALVPEVGGTYRPMMGEAANVTSGVGVASLVEQGSTTMAAFDDGYSSASAELGQLLLDNVVQRHQIEGQRPKQITISRNGAELGVVFNAPEPEGLSNSLELLARRVEIGEVPASVAYRQQRGRDLRELAKALPPQMQAILVPWILRNEDVEGAEEIAAQFQEQLAGPPQTPQDQAQTAATAAESAALALRERAAKIQESEARVRKIEAEAAALVDKLRQQVSGLGSLAPTAQPGQTGYPYSGVLS